MTAKRTPLRRAGVRRLTPQAIEAWKACDYQGLHLALGLAPFEQSPLPDTVTALGVSEDSGPRSDSKADPWGYSWQQAIELQRELYEVAGPPDTEALRREYTKKLNDAREMLAFYEKECGRRRDPEWTERQILKSREEVAWREQLLENLMG